MNASEREGQTQIALFPQCTARVDALHCRSGCSALRKRLHCTAGKGHIMADERPVLWRTALQAPECMWFFILPRI